MASSAPSIFSSVRVPSRTVFLMWGVFTVDLVLPMQLSQFGVVPRTTTGLLGILFSPLLHGSPAHIVSNTIPLLLLGTALYFFYRQNASLVFTTSWLGTGALVWLFGRQHRHDVLNPDRYLYHIGASGLIYSLAFYLMFLGFFRRDFRSIALSIVVVVFYGGLFLGLFSVRPHISYESHIFGALVGVGLAYALRKEKHTAEE